MTPEPFAARGATRRGGLALWGALLLALLLLPSDLRAHELAEGVGTQTSFFLFPDHIELEFNFGISSVASWTYLDGIDRNDDGRVDEAEADAFVGVMGDELVPKLDLHVNGRRVPLRGEHIVESWQIGIRGRIYAKAVDCYYRIRGPIPPALPDGGWWVHYHDGNFQNQTTTIFNWIYWQGHEPSVCFLIFRPQPVLMRGDYQTAGRDIDFFFDTRFRSDVQPGTTPVPTVAALAAIPLPGEGHVARDPRVGDAPAGTTPDAGGQSPTRSPPRGRRPETSGESTTRTATERVSDMVQELVSSEHELWELIVALALAVLYGAGHALSPGHGKSMVTAYLIGTRGRIRDALLLGAVVTFAHTFVVFVLGLILLEVVDGAAQTTYQNWMITGFGIASGAILVVFGLVMARSRLRAARRGEAGHGHHHHGWFGHTHPHLGADSPGELEGHEHLPEHAHGGEHAHDHPLGHHHAHDHGHDHDHPHDHAHDHDHQHAGDHAHGHPPDHAHHHAHPATAVEPLRFTDSSPTARQIVGLGFSGGMVPCPAGFVILLVAAHFQALGLGLLILTFFSLGLGGVLVAIGIALVLGRGRLLDRIGRRGRGALRWLPVFSSLLVSALGGYFIWNACTTGREPLAQMLRAAADWLTGH